MDCEYAKKKSRTECECVLRHDFCGYVYYCNDERTIKNTTRYVNCSRRKREQEKKEGGEQ